MKRATIAALALLAGACAGGRAERMDTVSDADYGRLQPGQTQAVDEARQQELQARDELARAKLRVTDTQHEDELAKADQTAAESDDKRAKAEAKIAADSNDPAQKQRAQELAETAQLHKKAADAHLDYAKKLIDARKAEVTAAQKRLDVTSAKVNLAKLQALQSAQIPAAGKYDVAATTNHVSRAQRDHDDAMQKAHALDAQVSSAQQTWQDLNQQLQARVSGATKG